MAGENESTELTDEQAADAARIAAMVEDAPAVAGQEPEAPAAPQVSPEEALAGFLTIAGMAAGIAGMTRTASIWNQGACRALADKAVPVMAKYAWGQRVIAFLQDGAGVEEMALLMVAAPMMLATVGAVRADLAEKQPEPPEPAAPGNVVAFSPAGNAAMVAGNANG